MREERIVSTTTIFRGLLAENEKKYTFEFKKEPRNCLLIWELKKENKVYVSELFLLFFSLYFNIHRSVTFTKHIYIYSTYAKSFIILILETCWMRILGGLGMWQAITLQQTLKTGLLKPVTYITYQCFGSGSASGNVDLDPGTKKNRDKLAYKSTQIIKI